MMSPKFILLSFAFVTIFSFGLTAQKNNHKQVFNKHEIQKYIKAEMKAEQIPGLAYAVVLDDKIIDSGAYGWANLELKSPVTMHSKFAIGSTGKIFTASAIMLLQKERKLSIDDPINKYLDSLPESWKKITIRHLLSHTSGIKDYLNNFPGYIAIEDDDARQDITEADFLRMLKKYRLNFEPGERWAYCNAGFVLLGFIVHKVSGMPLPQFMKQNFFDPLGMKETQYVSVSEIIPNRASGYSFDDNNKLSNGMYISNFYSSLGDMGIITTAGDMAKWSIALDKKKILDKETLEQMWTPAQLKNGMEVTDIAGSYGLGWGVEDYRGYKLLGHTGSFGSGYAADFIRFPEKNLSVIILTNLNSTESRWISCNLAGFFSPELKGIDQLSVQQNKASNPTKVYALLKGLGNDNLYTSESHAQK
jgi:CubicO group peptidase (beta-lactamase class C family)